MRRQGEWEGVELNPNFVAIAKQRLAQHSEPALPGTDPAAAGPPAPGGQEAG